MAPAQNSRNHRQRQASQASRSIRMLIELSIGVHKFHASINFYAQAMFSAICCLYVWEYVKQENVNHLQAD